MKYADCCQLLLTNKKQAATAEQLMRSRFTAYTRSDWKYLYKTWHSSTRPHLTELRSGESNSVEWLSLKVIQCTQGQAGDSNGLVEFVATYTTPQGIEQLKELSKFVFEHNKWLYLNAVDTHA